MDDGASVVSGENPSSTRPRRSLGNTQPTQPHSPAPEGTAPHRAVKRAGRRVGCWWWGIALLLGGLILFNMCATVGAWLSYYAFAAEETTPPPGSPPPPLVALLTAVPQIGQTPTPIVAPEPAKGVATILLLGIDERPDQRGLPTRTDTMIALRADFDGQTARLLSFPRDMWVAQPNLENYNITQDRINKAYFYGELYQLPGGGPKQAMDTVTLNFGFHIDYYALVNFDGFVKAVDALGGIDIDVPKAIHDPAFPTDDYNTIVLDIPAGRQHMNGLTALRYARTRHQDSDTERVKRQQLVLLAIRDKAVSLNAVTKLPELLAIAGDSFRTDMSLSQMISYAVAGQQIPRDRIETYAIDQTMLKGWTTPGGANVWIPDRQKIAPVIEAFLRE